MWRPGRSEGVSLRSPLSQAVDSAMSEYPRAYSKTWPATPGGSVGRPVACLKIPRSIIRYLASSPPVYPPPHRLRSSPSVAFRKAVFASSGVLHQMPHTRKCKKSTRYMTAYSFVGSACVFPTRSPTRRALILTRWSGGGSGGGRTLPRARTGVPMRRCGVPYHLFLGLMKRIVTRRWSSLLFADIIRATSL